MIIFRLQFELANIQKILKAQHPVHLYIKGIFCVPNFEQKNIVKQEKKCTFAD